MRARRDALRFPALRNLRLAPLPRFSTGGMRCAFPPYGICDLAPLPRFSTGGMRCAFPPYGLLGGLTGEKIPRRSIPSNPAVTSSLPC